MGRRVVITGMGVVTPVGNDIETAWGNIKKGVHGIAEITHFDIETQKVKLGAEVKDFEYPDSRAAKRLDRHGQYGLVAAKEAIMQSGIESGKNVDPYRFGVMGGTGIGGIETLEKEISKATVKGVRFVSALLVPMVIPNILAGNLSIEFQAKGSSIGLSTACAAGTHSIGEAFRNIKDGYAEVILAGSAEAPFSSTCFAGFANMTAMTKSTDPDRASIPFDQDREGFVMGEGAGFFVLEELSHALNRGAKIIGEIVGYGTTCDAYHLTSPSPEGEGAAVAMEQAIKEAGITAEEIDYINAHGTGTPYNDLFETRAVKKVFGEKTKVPMSSTKSMTGHLLGAAGSIEAAFCLKAIEEGFIPPTIGIKMPDPELDLDYVPDKGRNVQVKYALSNSLGFGGHNGTIILKKYEG